MTDVGTAIAIDARGLTRQYAGVTVVRGVDLALPAGSKTALLGSNGAGKTTLLKMLSTLLTPTSGSFSVNGHRAPSAEVARSIGVLGHSPMLYEDFTPLENLQFFARIYGVQDAEPRIRDLLDQVGLWRRRNERTVILSRGYHQRLALCRALIHRPAVLIADEPETGLGNGCAKRKARFTINFRGAVGRAAIDTDGFDLFHAASLGPPRDGGQAFDPSFLVTGREHV